MNNTNPTPGYYTPIDGRIYGPVEHDAPEHRQFEYPADYFNARDIHKAYVITLPPYAVSPDLELKEKMYELKDFIFITEKETGNNIAYPYPTEVGDYQCAPANPVKASVEGEVMFYDQPIRRKNDTPSFTSKDMVDFGEFMDRTRNDRYIMENNKWRLKTTSEMLDRFLRNK